MGKPRRNHANPNTAPKIERKIIEKNRRNKMKNLYSKLVSLLPVQTTQVEGVPLPDQIDVAVEYINNMTAKLEKLKGKKEFLLQRKKPNNNNSCVTFTNYQAKNNSIVSPTIEVQDMGPNLDVILANELPNYSIFGDIIKLVHQQYHGVEIASASFARDGHSSIQILHDKVAQLKSNLDGATISRKLRGIGVQKRGSFN